MNTQEFMKAIFHQTEENGKLEEYKNGLPIGMEENGKILLAQTREKAMTVKNTCVTGADRTDFIRRMLVTLSCLYETGQACYFILSPRAEYGELLRLRAADVTAPYVRSKEDLDRAMETLRELMRLRATGGGHPHLFLVLDGLDELSDVSDNGELNEYRVFNEFLSHKEGVDIITGVDLGKSIFAGYPGAFLGIGNCLVTTKESGKADVTYVTDDSSLSLPLPMSYPCEPTVMDSIVLLNTLTLN